MNGKTSRLLPDSAFALLSDCGDLPIQAFPSAATIHLEFGSIWYDANFSKELSLFAEGTGMQLISERICSGTSCKILLLLHCRNAHCRVHTAYGSLDLPRPIAIISRHAAAQRASLVEISGLLPQSSRFVTSVCSTASGNLGFPHVLKLSVGRQHSHKKACCCR